MHVKAGEPPRAANREGQTEPPAKVRDLLDALRRVESRKIAHAPGYGEQAGRDAEGDHVGERIELNAKFGVCAGEPSDAPIERIKDHR